MNALCCFPCVSVHGNALGDDGVRALCGSLAVHPNVIHLDLGDCKMTQMGIAHISKLLPEQGAKRGRPTIHIIKSKSSIFTIITLSDVAWYGDNVTLVYVLYH